LQRADPPSIKYFRSLEQWNCLFKSHSTHGCLRAFILCLCLIADLRWADPPSKGIFSLTRKTELWVRIPFKSRMSACVHSVFVLGSGFAMADPPLQAIFSFTRTIELCVRIPIRLWTSACIHSVFVLRCGFAIADPPSKK
jgi:hypothetical protein